MEIAYKPTFLRQFKKLPKQLQEEAKQKIELFRDVRSHRQLRVHKLGGDLEGLWSFSINYRYRIVFEWEKKGESVVCLGIGDHSLYD